MDLFEWSEGDETPLAEQLFGMNTSCSSFLPDSSIGAPSVAASTPRKKKTFKKPGPPRLKPGQRLCTRCQKIYRSLKAFNDHCNLHVYIDLASRRPNTEDIFKLFVEKSATVLEAMAKTPAVGCRGEEFKALVAKTEKDVNLNSWRAFLEAVFNIFAPMLGDKLVLPSQLRSKLLRETNQVLNNVELVEGLIAIEMPSWECSADAANAFLVKFIFHLMDIAIIHICKCMRQQSVQVQSTYADDDFDFIYSKQALHRIVGSTVRGILRRCFKNQSSVKWQRVKEVITQKFCKGSVPVANASEVGAWTAALDRGKLLYVEDNELFFFVELAKKLSVIELPKGSLIHNDVLQKVFTSPDLLSLWNDVVENDLSHEESLNLMINLMQSFTNTFGVGVLLRRQNASVSAPKVASLGLRALLASDSSAKK